jgi:hypothetical protein
MAVERRNALPLYNTIVPKFDETCFCVFQRIFYQINQNSIKFFAVSF